MQNEEVIIQSGSVKQQHLTLKRKWHFVECLSRVMVYINGVEVATLGNGKDLIIPVEPDSVIELDLQSPSMHNYYEVEITEYPKIDFGFTLISSGSFFKYNNIRIYNHSGCRISKKGTELSKLQKLDNKFRYIAIGICGILYVIIQLSQCHFRIN